MVGKIEGVNDSCRLFEQESNTLVIYSALEQYRNDDLKAHLAEKFPDLNVQIMYMPTAKVAAKIQTEKEHSDADIVLGVETGYMEKMKDSLADVAKYSHLDYIDGMLPEHGKYLIWESYGGGVRSEWKNRSVGSYGFVLWTVIPLAF